ncbi:hypothetical protein Hanom_Chr14g01261621 [Helianthus anomalus]
MLLKLIQKKGFVLIGEAFSLPYSLKEVIRLVKVNQRKQKVRKADKKLLLYKEEKNEEEEEKLKDEEFKSYEITSVKPTTQYTLDDFLNDQLNEQQDDQQQKSSSSGKQDADRVFLTPPKVIYFHSAFEGELEVPRTREEMLEELAMDDGNLKFDIEVDIPSSPKREYSLSFPNEADNFNDVIIEEGSDISEEDTPFHYSGS